MGQLDIKVNLDFKIPDLRNGNDLLEDISGRIADDAAANIRQQRGFDGRGFKALAKSTIAKKKRRGYANPNLALFATGIMFRGISSVKKKNNEFVAKIIARGTPRRDDVAFWQQKAGVNNITKITRPFLGISADRMLWIRKRIDRWVRSKIEKATKLQKTYTT